MLSTENLSELLQNKTVYFLCVEWTFESDRVLLALISLKSLSIGKWSFACGDTTQNKVSFEPFASVYLLFSDGHKASDGYKHNAKLF